MRLLHTTNFRLQNFAESEVPRYSILSHTWGKEEEEVTLQDLETDDVTKRTTKLVGHAKVKMACAVAAADGFDYIWIDTCCIDKTSSAELSEALNSMYRWYRDAEECYAYLVEVSQNTANQPNDVIGPALRQSKWFTRGWTLQELIAPPSVIFLNREWQEIGTRSSLYREVSDITGIPSGFLLGDDLAHASIAQRMSWASSRRTKRTEDIAYCLMGLFDICMPMLYGEGQRAFIRLQEEIIKVPDDHSLFAWRSNEDHGGLLATSPAAFAGSGNIISINPSNTMTNHSITSSRGIHLSLPFINNHRKGLGLAILRCTETGKERERFAIYLRDAFLTKEDFVREHSSVLDLICLDDINSARRPMTSLHVRNRRPARNIRWEDIEKCAVKLVAETDHEVALRTVILDPNWELCNGFMITSTMNCPSGILGRSLFVYKDGGMFQILIRKCGNIVTANIINSSNPDAQIYESPDALDQVPKHQDRVFKLLDDTQRVHVAIKKRVLLLGETICHTAVVEISYSSPLSGTWLEQVAVLERNVGEKTLLTYAAWRGLDGVVNQLLKQDAALEARDMHGRTALSIAAERGDIVIVGLLLERGAAPQSRDEKGYTPILFAAKCGNKAIVELLLEKDAALEEKDRHGSTALSIAAERGDIATVSQLLQSLAAPNSFDENRRTLECWAG